MLTKRNWPFIAAAAIPGAAALLFCGTGIREWWLIRTHQIVVIPTPHRGDTSLPEMPASNALPLVAFSGLVTVLFAYALLRGSKKALISGYLIVGLVAALAWLRHTL